MSKHLEKAEGERGEFVTIVFTTKKFPFINKIEQLLVYKQNLIELCSRKKIEQGFGLLR